MNSIPEILPDVVGRIKEHYQKEIRISQPRSNWASSLGHPCVRYGVHRRLDWDKRPPHDVVTQMIFNGGNVIEKHISKVYLENAGFTIVEYNRPIQNEVSGMFERLNIGGYLDFICKDEQGGFEFPVEAKSMNPYSWEKINCIEDMLFSKKSWELTYPAQLTTYMLARNYERGLFLLINKTTFEPKAIWISLDMTYAEELMKRAEEINKHVAAGTYPERIPYDEGICGRCDFAQVCLSDYVRTEAEILTNQVLIDNLERREQLKPMVKEYDEIDKDVKTEIKKAGIAKGIAGDFILQTKTSLRKGYEVAEQEVTTVSIQKLKQK